MTSSWSLGGEGYLDFDQNDFSDARYLKVFWVGGTALGLVVMTAGLVYVVAEWLLQSHMNSLDQRQAMKGLGNVRRWRRYTYPIRRCLRAVIGSFATPASRADATKPATRPNGEEGRADGAVTARTGGMKKLRWTPEEGTAPEMSAAEDIIRRTGRRFSLHFDHQVDDGVFTSSAA